MDQYEVTRVLYARVQTMEPENVSKIMGYLLLQDHAEQEMLHLALASDNLLSSMITKVKKDLGLIIRQFPSSISSSTPPISTSSSSSSVTSTTSSSSSTPSPSSPPFINAHIHHLSNGTSPAPLQPYPGLAPNNPFHNYNALYSKQQQQQQPQLSKMLSFQHHHHHQLQQQEEQQKQQQQQGFHTSEQASIYGASGVFPNDHFYPETFAFLSRNRLRAATTCPQNLDDQQQQQQQLLNVVGSPDQGSPSGWKPCVYFARGFCKHGSGCRFLHNPNCGSATGSWDELEQEDEMQALSLEMLEMELQDLLRSYKSPVSIASLPQLYFEKFGKSLQADGYLTESQRQGKAGYSLTKLLSRLKNSVVLIDRPHGQHALVLAEDASRFTMHRGCENYDLNGNNPSSRQIYLTFPAESAFSEEDVSAHFSAYGSVQDVRIPYQQKRMFGFVTFVHSETVKTILSEGNPHYVCGARVLVKPYREKGKHERKQNLSEQSKYYQTQNGSSGLTHEDIYASKVFEENLYAMQQQRENGLQLERRIMELQLAGMQRFRTDSSPREQLQNIFVNHSHQEDLHTTTTVREETQQNTHQNSRFGYFLDALDVGAVDNEKVIEANLPRIHEVLPDSPFTGTSFDIKQEMSYCAAELEGFSLNEPAAVTTV